MGGNAIKKVLISRMEVSKYSQVKQIISDAFKNIIQIDFAFDKPGKESYGDLDVLYMRPDDTNLNLVDQIVKLFNPVEIVTNGLVISWAYHYNEDKYFQIDMVKCTNISMCKFYYSYGDLGNILGRITKYHGLKFGHEGLFVNLINLEPINLTSEPEIICKYLNLDWDLWIKGFDTEEEIFKWIVGSNLFVPNMFLELEEINHLHRQKTQRRPMYSKWVKWVCLFKYNLNSDKVQDIKLTEYSRKNLSFSALEHFGKIEIYNQLIQLKEKKEMLKKKFNGSKLIKLGIKEKNIGESIQAFKIWVENTHAINFETWIELTDENEIDRNMLKFFV